MDFAEVGGVEVLIWGWGEVGGWSDKPHGERCGGVRGSEIWIMDLRDC